MIHRGLSCAVIVSLILANSALGEDGVRPIGETSAVEKLLANYERHVAERLKPVHKQLAKELLAFETSLTKGKQIEAAIVVREARVAHALESSENPASAPFPIDVEKFAKEHEREASTLKSVRDHHDQRVSRVLNPARKKLVAELGKLEDMFSRSGQLNDALLAKRERERMEMAASVPKGAKNWNGHFYLIYDEKVTWKEAVVRCQKLGGHLVTVTSKEENELLLELTQKEPCWLGASDEKKEGKWRWVTSEEFEFTGSFRPDNHQGKQHYLCLFGSAPAWDDDSASSKHRFICEWEIAEALR